MRILFLVFVVGIEIFAVNSLLAMEGERMDKFPHTYSSKVLTWEFLNEGECIEIIAPSAAPLTSQHKHAVKEFIHQHGLKSGLSEGIFNKEASRYQYYAHSDEERTKHFINALQGNSKALWAILGGYGTAEVVAIIERSSFSPPACPKLIIGFSDITALHLLAASWGWPSLHGPVAGLGKELYSETQEDVNRKTELSSVFKIIKGEINHLEHTFEVIHPGNNPTEMPIVGSVIGGNLSIIENHSGTKTALDGKGRFVFFEDTPEDGKRLNRRLMNLVRTGVFDEAKGIIIGNNPIEEFENSPQATKKAMNTFVTQFLLPKNINIPVVYSPRFGHGPYNDLLPLGTMASLSIQGEQALLRVSVNESAYKQ